MLSAVVNTLFYGKPPSVAKVRARAGLGLGLGLG